MADYGHEYDENNDATVLTIRVGYQQAQLLASGVGFLLSDMIRQEALVATSENPKDEETYMRMLSQRMDATEMFRGLWTAMGIPETETENALDALDDYSEAMQDEVALYREEADAAREFLENEKELKSYRRRQRWLAGVVVLGGLVNMIFAYNVLMGA